MVKLVKEEKNELINSTTIERKMFSNQGRGILPVFLLTIQNRI